MLLAILWLKLTVLITSGFSSSSWHSTWLHIPTFLHRWGKIIISGQSNVSRNDMHRWQSWAIKPSTEDPPFHLFPHITAKWERMRGLRAEENHKIMWTWIPEWLHGTETLQNGPHCTLIQARKYTYYSIKSLRFWSCLVKQVTYSN